MEREDRLGLVKRALTLLVDRLGRDDTVAIVTTAEITNTGDLAGAEVVQLYIGARTSLVERAPKELKAFTKIELQPGETRTVRLAVPAIGLAYYDEGAGWIVEPGEYEAILGRHSLDQAALTARFRIDPTVNVDKQRIGEM